MNQESILIVENIVKRFGGLYALNKVSLEVERGNILGLIGPNGSGKTTLFNLITGMHTPNAGAIYFNGEEITGLEPHKIARKGIGRTFQIVRPFSEMTVMENVYVSAAFGCMRREKSVDIRDICYDALKITNLEHRADTPTEPLTLAEKRRLEIARALALRPKLLLLDETMAGLTSTEVDQALNMIRKINRDLDLTTVVVEHIMRAVMTISEKVVVLNEGTKIAEGTPKEVSENQDVLKAYLGERTNSGRLN